MKIETAKTEDISADPANAREHSPRNIEAIKASLKAFGQQKPIIVDKRGIVIAGSGTLEAAKSIGWKKIDIVRTELEGSQATAFGIADNRTAELAEWDGEVLGSLLDSLDEELREVIAFNNNEIAVLVDAGGEPNDPVEEWTGMPEFAHEDLTSFRRVIVHFKSNEDVAAFGTAIKQTMTEKTRSIWFPPDEIGRTADKTYADQVAPTSKK